MARVSKEKQEKTLKKMKETRKQDSIHLRTIIDKKLEWAEAEYKKGVDYIVQLKKSIETTEQQVLRLEGCISSLRQVLKDSQDKEEKPDVNSNN